jgi:carboxymethylenebutenolidase
MERRLDVRTQDGVLDCYLFTPDQAASAGTPGPAATRWPLVIVYMDAFGIRSALAGMAERLASHGYAVALPNLYYRHGGFAPFDPKAVAAGGAERDRFKAMIASITNTMVMADTAQLIAALDTSPLVRRGPIAVVGYCMGGGFALSAAGTFPERVAAGASFHGGSLATDKPDSAHLLAPRIRARLYVGVAGIDPTFDDAQRQRLQEALDAAGVTCVLEVYEGAKHGFAVDEHLAYDRQAAERHWSALTALLRDTLGSADSQEARGTRAGG